ncbi:MAG: PDZ domain-containing protein [Novosphingobium sp.]
MQPVQDSGVNNKWPILAALILLVAGAAAVPHLQWHAFERAPRRAVTLLPGLTVEEALPPRQGLIVTSLQNGSESARSGIVVGDHIEALDHHRVRDSRDTIDYLKKDRASTIVLEIVHDQARRDVRLRRLGEAYHGP